MKLKVLCAVCIIFSSYLWAKIEGGPRIPEFEKKILSYKKILVLTPKVELFEIDVGGLREKRDDWSNEAFNIFKNSISYHLGANNIEAIFINPEDEKSQDAKDLKALIPVVAYCVRIHTHLRYNEGIDTFYTKYDNYDYSIGSIKEILKKYNADAILYITAEDEEATSGRKVRKALNVLNPFSAHMATTETYIFAAIIGDDGLFLWQDYFHTEYQNDLRKQYDSDYAIAKLLYTYPKFVNTPRHKIKEDKPKNPYMGGN